MNQRESWNPANSALDEGAPSHPREISVHVEELVLHGFDAHAGSRIADALTVQLQTLLAEKGLPHAWVDSPPQINVNSSALTNPGTAGGELARAIHGGGES